MIIEVPARWLSRYSFTHIEERCRLADRLTALIIRRSRQ